MSIKKKHREGAEVRPYDFRRPIQMSKGFERTINMVADSFAKLATLSLNNYLRIPVSVESKGARQVLFEEYTSSIENPSCINILGLHPIKVPGILEIDLSLILTMMEKLMGGKYLGRDVHREFTSIEGRIARNIVTRILEGLEEALQRMIRVDTTLTAIEHNPDFTYIMNANDPCVLIEFKLEVGDYEGAMNLCISLSSLDAELGGDSTLGLHDLRSEDERHNDVERLHGILKNTPAEIRVEIGRIPMSMEEVRELEEGQIFSLRQQADQPLILRVEGCPLFKGKMGRLKRKAAVKVTEFIYPQGDNGSGKPARGGKNG